MSNDTYDEEGFEPTYTDEKNELKISKNRKNKKKNKDSGRKKAPSRVIAIFIIFFLVLSTAAFISRDKIPSLVESFLQMDSITTDENPENTYEDIGENGNSPKITVESSTKATFIGYDKNFLYCTKDGVKLFDSNYNSLWNYTYTLTSPSVVNNGNITAIAELQGRSLRVYNDKGEMYTLQTDGSILQMEVNSNGAIGVILKTGNGYKIQAYSDTGQLLMERIEQDEGIYPIALDISDDKRVMAVSYIDTTDIEIMGKVLLFHTGKSDAISSETGDFFASVSKGDTLITVIRYLENGSFVAVGDNKIFALDTSGKELWNIPVDNKIDYVSFGGSNYIVVAYGETINTNKALDDGTVIVYDLNGKEKFQFSVGRPVTYLNAYRNGVVIGAGREFVCMNYSKSVQWSHTATQDIKDIILLSSPNSALYVTNSFAEIVDMKK